MYHRWDTCYVYEGRGGGMYVMQEDGEIGNIALLRE